MRIWRCLRSTPACFLSAVDVGNTAAESLSLWSDLATHCAALWWHRVAVTRPKGYGNIPPRTRGCQNQHTLKICAFYLLPIWATLTDVLRHRCRAAIPNRITPLAHVHERNPKCDLLELRSAEYALSKQAWRGSLWHNHVGKSRPKYYPELKLTWIFCLWYPANAVNTRR